MDIDEKIIRIKRETEQRYLAKIEKSKQLKLTIEDILADEEIQEFCRLNDLFEGRIADFSKAQRFEKLKKVGQWLDAHSMEVKGLSTSPVSSDKQNAIVMIDIKKLSILEKDDLKVFIAMFSLSDSVFISSVNDGFTRVSFYVQDVYSESVELPDKADEEDEEIF